MGSHFKVVISINKSSSFEMMILKKHALLFKFSNEFLKKTNPDVRRSVIACYKWKTVT